VTRRSILGAVASALVVVAPAPGLASAAAPIRVGNLDQDVEPQAGSIIVPVGSPATAGASGRLSYVALYCSTSSAGGDVVSIVMGSAFADSLCTASPGWVQFAFREPPTVLSGAHYGFTILAHSPDGDTLAIASTDYAGGCLQSNGTCRQDVTDIAFRTYVQPSPTVKFAWNPAQVHAGASTPVTLTIQAGFPGYLVPDTVSGSAAPAVSADVAEIVLDSHPSWFTPGAITCSTSAGPQACGNYPGPFEIAMTGSPLTVTITITGTAVIPNPAGNQQVIVAGSGCIAYVFAEVPFTDCGATGRAEMAILGAAATPAPTPVPTLPVTASASDSQGTSGEPYADFLPAFLLAALASGFVVRSSLARVKPNRR
jgi:hypothetical protein